MALMHDGQIRQKTPETPDSKEAWWKNKAAVVALIGTLAAGGIGGAVLASGEDTPNPEPTATAPENPVAPETPADTQTEQAQNPETENELEGYMPLVGNDPEKIVDAFVNNFELALDNTEPRYLTDMGYSLESDELSEFIGGMIVAIEEIGQENYSFTNDGNYNPADMSWEPIEEKPLPETLDRNTEKINFNLSVFTYNSSDGKFESLHEGEAFIDIARNGEEWRVNDFGLFFSINTDPFY